MNLIYQKQQFLYTQIGPSNLATYTDKDSVKKLILKDKGIELSGGSRAQVSKSYTDYAMRKAVLLTQTKNAPASTRDVDYGFRIVAEFKNPGYIDNSEVWPHGKFYGGTYPNLSTFTDTQVVDIDNKIIDMIEADKGFNQDQTTPTGAIVRSRRAYTVVDTDNTDASGFTITWPDGTTTVFATGTTFADGQIGEQLMADATVAYGSTVGALLEAYQIAADTFVITSRNPGLKFTLGTAIDTTISTPGILIDSKFDDIKFRLEYDPYEWTAQGLNITKIAQSDFTAALNAHVSVDGAVTEVTAATDQDTQRDAISAITGVTALNDSTDGFTVASALTVKSMAINFPVENAAGTDHLTATTASITYEATTEGKFSSLTSDDVHRIFAEADHAGFLRTAIRGVGNSLPDTEYTCYTITGVSKVGSIHGANHLDDSFVTIQLYIPTEATRGDKWDATDNATGNDVPSGGLDQNIDQLLANWKS